MKTTKKNAYRPSEYTAIRLWHGSSMSHYITNLQEKAAADGAPLDAIYWSEGHWHTVAELRPRHSFRETLRSCGIDAVEPVITREYIEATIRQAVLRALDAACRDELGLSAWTDRELPKLFDGLDPIIDRLDHEAEELARLDGGPRPAQSDREVFNTP